MKIRLGENELKNYIYKAMLEETNWAFPGSWTYTYGTGTETNGPGYGVLLPKEDSDEDTQPPVNLVYGKRAPFANVKKRVAKFQTWFNLNLAKQIGFPAISVDGFWGNETQGAWNAWLNNEYGLGK